MNAETAQATVAVCEFTVQLSATARGARLARLLATEQLGVWELPFEEAAHVVAELAANAATHGRVPGRDFHLTLAATESTLRIEVTDTRGDRLPCAQLAATEGESGRGLVLVEALADRWGVELGAVPRKTVWAELSLLPPKHSGPCSGAPSALPQETREGKNLTKPHPSLPPVGPRTARTHSRE